MFNRNVVPFDTAKGTESRPGRNRNRRFPPDPRAVPYWSVSGCYGTSPDGEDCLM